jgi:CBS domain-containing protein
MSRRTPVKPSIGVPRRVEKHRWLRSDGKPNFQDRIYKNMEELELIAKKPVAKVSESTPLLTATEEMARGYRSLIVCRGGKLAGLLLSTHLINYLGGGDYFKIVKERHSYNVYSALEKEPVETIMERNPIVAYIDEKLPNILEKMVLHEIGIVPVTLRDGTIYGIITEHDIVKYLSSTVRVGITVSEVMTSPAISIGSNASLGETMQTMIKYGFRRLPVVEDNIVEGIIGAMDIVKFFGTHKAFEKTVHGDIREILQTPLNELYRKDVYTITPEEDVCEAARIMLDKNVGSLLVVNDKMELLGIITERDVLYALVAERKR